MEGRLPSLSTADENLPRCDAPSGPYRPGVTKQAVIDPLCPAARTHATEPVLRLRSVGNTGASAEWQWRRRGRSINTPHLCRWQHIMHFHMSRCRSSVITSCQYKAPHWSRHDVSASIHLTFTGTHYMLVQLSTFRTFSPPGEAGGVL